MNNSSFRFALLVGLTAGGLAMVACGKDSAPSDVTGTGGSSGSGGDKATSGTGGAKSTGGAATSTGGAGTGAKTGAGGAAGGGDVPDASAGGTVGTDDGGTPGTGGGGGGGTGGASDCFTNPTTHFEIINACTNAEKVDKTPKVPLLLPDGGLPALP